VGARHRVAVAIWPISPDVFTVVSVFLLALVVVCAWFIAVVAFHVTAAAIHILLFVALVLFAVAAVGRRVGARRRAV
jgi:predicted permease